jgi:hypothetical protein
MLVSNGLIFGGLIVMGKAWRQIHRARGGLVREGLYGVIRHPQYAGLVLVIAGFLIQWPTIITVPMGPGLVYMYYRLSRREEEELEALFGEEYRYYKEAVPAFVPRPGMVFRPRAQEDSQAKIRPLSAGHGASRELTWGEKEALLKLAKQTGGARRR